MLLSAAPADDMFLFICLHHSAARMLPFSHLQLEQALIASLQQAAAAEAAALVAQQLPAWAPGNAAAAAATR
jgi:hypothetical protein